MTKEIAALKSINAELLNKQSGSADLQSKIAQLTEDNERERKLFQTREKARELEEIRLTEDLQSAKDQLQMLQETLLQQQAINQTREE
jgi:DNA repair exonuclease SbcCD ATPase subunit